MSTPESWDRHERSRRWSLVADIAERLVDDRDLAEEFERTPGKVLRLLGIRESDIAEVLAILQQARELASADPVEDG